MDDDRKGLSSEVYLIKKKGMCWSPYDQYGNRIWICEGQGPYDDSYTVIDKPAIRSMKEKWKATFDIKDEREKRRAQEEILSRVFNRYAGSSGWNTGSVWGDLDRIKCDGTTT
jgi:hypothetical protein